MKAVLLRVGIDSNYGSLSPIFPDCSYQYIPIYNKNKIEIEKGETRTFHDLKGFNNISLSNYLPDNLKNKTVHYDPEFETFTYGEVSNPKRAALLKLVKADLLIFYLGGIQKKVNGKSEIGCFIFGYFIVENVFEWKKLDAQKKQKIKIICKYNAHIISSKSRENLVIVKGSRKSKILNKCIKFTRENEIANNPAYVTSDYFQQNFGIRKNVIRAVPLTIKDSKYIEALKNMLEI